VVAMLDFWRGQQERIIKRIMPKVPRSRKAEEDILLALNNPDFWDAETKALLKVLLPLISAGAEMGVLLHAASIESVGMAVDWTLAHTEAQEWALKWCGDLVTKVDDTTKKRIASEVVNWIESGEHVDELAKKLMDPEYYGFSRKRAQLIAQTETTNAFNGGEWTAARAAEKEGYFSYEKQWETVRDENVCNICEPLQYNGTNAVQGVEGWFQTEVGAFQGPAAHPGCRCWVNYVALVPE